MAETPWRVGSGKWKVESENGGGTGDPARPFFERGAFSKMSFRGAKRRGNPYSPYNKRCGAWVLRIATASVRTGFAMTNFFEGMWRLSSGG